MTSGARSNTPAEALSFPEQLSRFTRRIFMSNEEKVTTTSKPIVHEGPSVSIPASQISFINTGVKTDKGELRAGPAYGDLQNGRHGTFVRMPAAFKSPVHTHTEDYFAVVVEGVGSNHPGGGEAE